MTSKTNALARVRNSKVVRGRLLQAVHNGSSNYIELVCVRLSLLWRPRKVATLLYVCILGEWGRRDKPR